jgi:hypothetical protein
LKVESGEQHYESLLALLDPDEAMTITVRIALTPSVVDTRIVAATHRAAALYGYTDPTELEGRFASLLHVLEDIKQAHVRATLRSLGLADVAECYEVRIVQRSGEIQREVKHVEQRQVDDIMAWMSRFEPADPRAPFRPPPLSEAVPEAEIHRLFGRACLAEVETLLRRNERISHWKPSQTLGDLLRQARQARGLSLRQAAPHILRVDGVPVTRQYLSDIERGRRTPSPHIVQQLAHPRLSRTNHS